MHKIHRAWNIVRFIDDAPASGGGEASNKQDTNPAANQTGTDLATEVEKWKALSRKNEDRAKANAEKARLYDEAQEKSKTELQKALDARAAAEKRAAELETQALRLKIGATKNVDPELLVGTTQEEIEASADRLLAWKGPEPKTPASTSSADAGARGVDISGEKQLSREDLKSMTPAEINKARKDGRLKDVLSAS